MPSQGEIRYCSCCGTIRDGWVLVCGCSYRVCVACMRCNDCCKCSTYGISPIQAAQEKLSAAEEAFMDRLELPPGVSQTEAVAYGQYRYGFGARFSLPDHLQKMSPRAQDELAKNLFGVSVLSDEMAKRREQKKRMGISAEDCAWLWEMKISWDGDNRNADL